MTGRLASLSLRERVGVRGSVRQRQCQVLGADGPNAAASTLKTPSPRPSPEGRGRSVALFALLLAAAGPPGASSCTGCHLAGAGVGVLQGRPAADTAAQMEAFRSGARPATLMNRIVRGFTPDEVRALADWFAVQG